MKTGFFSVFLITIILFLSGCSDSNETDTISPTSAPLPSISPPSEYVPDPECNHFWKDPDCVDPYICYDCDGTQGSPLEHIWTVANYQKASYCVNCGEINGDPVEPKFLSHGFRINTTAGRPFQYKTITNPEPVEVTIGTASLQYIDLFETDIDYPEKEGYEYIVSRFMITFDDENSLENGFQFMTGQIDYFGFDPDESAVSQEDLRDSDIEGFKIASRKLNYYGDDYEYFVRYDLILSELVGDMWLVLFEHAFLVPAGYDGIVVYISNANNWTSSTNRVISDNFDSDTLFFRLRTQTT